MGNDKAFLADLIFFIFAGLIVFTGTFGLGIIVGTILRYLFG